jgi:RsiW-degrading membrane proteinase PrsW (M82 family)
VITVTCKCGKVTYGSEAMAGQEVQCMKCAQLVVFPAPKRQAALVGVAGAPGQADRPGASSLPKSADSKETTPVPEAAPSAKLPRRALDLFYLVLILALAPLVTALQHDEKATFKKRLDDTLQRNPLLKPRVEEIMESPRSTLDDLLKVLPGRKLDKLAHLPRDTRRHEVYAAISAVAFFLIIGVLMAWDITAAWKLLVTAAFTATFGIACLFIFQDMYGSFYEGMLEAGDKVGDRLFLNFIGFTLGVGLSEELAKALPVIFYIRTHRDASWRGACLWGLASGVGFGVAEGITYSVRHYNGIATADTYLTRFAACVALHAVWSGSVGITLFNYRRSVSKAVNAIMYGDIKEEDYDWDEILMPTAQVLGVAMVLHGLYDTLLTQQMVLPALVVALVSFAWLGFQIESAREEEARQLAPT